MNRKMFDANLIRKYILDANSSKKFDLHFIGETEWHWEWGMNKFQCEYFFRSDDKYYCVTNHRQGDASTGYSYDSDKWYVEVPCYEVNEFDIIVRLANKDDLSKVLQAIDDAGLDHFLIPLYEILRTGDDTYKD